MKDVAIQFFNGIDEKVVPQIRLTKSKDGQAGQAYFRFENPEALLSDNFKEIQGMYLLDEEGQITTREIHIAVGEQKEILIDSCVSQIDMPKKLVLLMKRIMNVSKSITVDNSLNLKDEQFPAKSHGLFFTRNIFIKSQSCYHLILFHGLFKLKTVSKVINLLFKRTLI